MTIVGITGGIGSGKSTVSKILTVMGYSVFNSDAVGKFAYQNEEIKKEVLALFGPSILKENNGFNFKKIGELVFSDKKLLLLLNNIIHPFVQKTFEEWCNKQNSKIVFKESAILFESGSNKKCDFIISVIADEKNRIKRVMKRNPELSMSLIKDRIDNQFADNELIEKSNLVIYNNNELLIPQVIKVLKKIE